MTHQLQAMEASIVLEVKPKHNNVTPIAVVKITGPKQNARNRGKIVERTTSRKTVEKLVKYAPPKILVITNN